MPERILVYHAGATKPLFLGAVRIGALCLIVISGLLVVPAYAEDRFPLWLATSRQSPRFLSFRVGYDRLTSTYSHRRIHDTSPRGHLDLCALRELYPSLPSHVCSTIEGADLTIREQPASDSDALHNHHGCDLCSPHRYGSSW